MVSHSFDQMATPSTIIWPWSIYSLLIHSYCVKLINSLKIKLFSILPMINLILAKMEKTLTILVQ